MPTLLSIPSDQKLVQIVDAALADSARRSGPWLACRPGCSQCCTGVFAINQLDALRLKNGLAELEVVDPDRAARILDRAHATIERLSPTYPGDPVTGILDSDNSDAAQQQWADFANDERCPVLDPDAGTCDLYTSRPITCRVFGPPVKSEGELGVCELCFNGATEEEIVACELVPDPDNLEEALIKEVAESSGATGETIIAFAIVR